MRLQAFTVALLMLGAAGLDAAQDTRVSWSGLGPLVNGRTVAVTLPDGTDLKGKVVEVADSRLVMDVARTSNRNAHPKGRTDIPKASVRVLQVHRSGAKWKVIGTTIGLGAGLAIAAPVNTYAHNEGDGAPLAVAAIVAGPAALGFLAGWAADRKTVTIVVTD